MSAHIFYQGDHDALLTTLVLPLVRDLSGRGLARAWFFLRYWDGGPHIRLRVLAPDDHAGEVRTRVEGEAAEYLARHPSSPVLTPEEYAGVAAHLAGREGVGHEREMRPIDSVAFLPYRREHARYGTGKAIEAVEDHFGESSALALAMLEGGVDRRARAAFALSAIFLANAVATPRRADLAERFGGNGLRLVPETVAAGDDGLYRAQRDTLLGLTDRWWTSARADPDAVRGGRDAQSRWLASLFRLRDRLTALPDPPPFGDLADVCGHLLTNRLGVGPEQEGRARYFLARVMADRRRPVPAAEGAR
ncbi:MAG: thiopeptide-type bacteriocin biosynthesis protein [Spirillospora sp.]